MDETKAERLLLCCGTGKTADITILDVIAIGDCPTNIVDNKWIVIQINHLANCWHLIDTLRHNPRILLLITERIDLIETGANHTCHLSIKIQSNTTGKLPVKEKPPLGGFSFDNLTARYQLVLLLTLVLRSGNEQRFEEQANSDQHQPAVPPEWHQLQP
jgi:hypothetical protein